MKNYTRVDIIEHLYGLNSDPNYNKSVEQYLKTEIGRKELKKLELIDSEIRNLKEDTKTPKAFKSEVFEKIGILNVASTASKISNFKLKSMLTVLLFFAAFVSANYYKNNIFTTEDGKVKSLPIVQQKEVKSTMKITEVPISNKQTKTQKVKNKAQSGSNNQQLENRTNSKTEQDELIVTTDEEELAMNMITRSQQYQSFNSTKINRTNDFVWDKISLRKMDNSLFDDFYLRFGFINSLRKLNPEFSIDNFSDANYKIDLLYKVNDFLKFGAGFSRESFVLDYLIEENQFQTNRIEQYSYLNSFFATGQIYFKIYEEFSGFSAFSVGLNKYGAEGRYYMGVGYDIGFSSSVFVEGEYKFINYKINGISETSNKVSVNIGISKQLDF